MTTHNLPSPKTPLTNKTLFRQLTRQRFMAGLLSTSISVLFLYALLSVHLHPHVETTLGLDIEFALWQGEKWWRILLVGVFVFLVTISATGQLTKQRNMQSIYPKRAENLVLPSHISADTLQQMTLDLADKMKVRVDSILVGDDPIPNAFATMGMESENIVVIHSNLVEILDIPSLQTVIAHELGHLKNQDVLHKIGNKIPLLVSRYIIVFAFIQILGVALLSQTMWQFVCRVGFGIGVLIFFSICSAIITRYEHWYGRMKEKMADAYAVEYTSLQASINSFVRLHERSHTLQGIIASLRHTDSTLDRESMYRALRVFPKGSISKEHIDEQIPRIYTQVSLEGLLEKLSVELPETTQRHWIDLLLQHKKAAENTQTNETAQPESTTEPAKTEVVASTENTEKPFVWQEFDWNHDGVLQISEIRALLTELEKYPKALTSEDGDGGEHPPIRERVLFLAKLFPEELEDAST